MVVIQRVKHRKEIYSRKEDNEEIGNGREIL
jgi:hypothetical protein